MKGPGSASKVTYVTLAGNEEANAAYDLAVSTVRASLSGTFPNWIDGARAGADRPLEAEDRGNKQGHDKRRERPGDAHRPQAAVAVVLPPRRNLATAACG
jgi:hypothetical protein